MVVEFYYLSRSSRLWFTCTIGRTKMLDNYAISDIVINIQVFRT